jgi:seryl-tRNA synthetase
MLQLNFIRENRELTLRGLKKKRFAEAEETLSELIRLDDERKSAQKKRDDLKAEANAQSKKIGELMRAGNKNEAEQLKQTTTGIKEKDKELSELFDSTEKKLHELLVTLPNLPQESVPEGKTAEDNVTLQEEGIKPGPEQCPLLHWELCAKYGIIDFELGVKLTGAGFPVYKGQGARLQRALIQFFLDRATAAGYTEYQPPILVNEQSGFGTGQLPDKEGQMYFVGEDNLYLIPTAEVPVTNIWRDVILKQEELPVKACAYTPCFRREAGSYGKDVRGLNRLHQFDKVEIVQITLPEKSSQAHQEMLQHSIGLLRSLGLPFRVLKLCGGDMSFASSLTFDLEVWSGAQQRWLEVSSVSNFESFQANRLKCRYRDDKGRTQLAHSLNGSALALPRIVAALLENNQTSEGIRIPDSLKAYCGFDLIR